MHTVTCVGCNTAFDSKSPRAKWCTAACRKRHQRARPAGDVEQSDAPGTTTPDADEQEPTGLVAAVIRDLTKAKALDTFDGQLAIQLAKRVTSPDESGISSLAKELRSVMAQAVGSAPPADADSNTPADEDDEVTLARRRREEARKEAGL